MASLPPSMRKGWDDSLTRSQKAYTARAATGQCRVTGCNNARLDNHTCCQTCRGVEIVRGRARMLDAKMRVLDAYGGRICVGCGETELVVLSLDHIDGGGNKHRKEIMGAGFRGGWGFYRWLIRQCFPPGFRVLCMNCQFRARAGAALPRLGPDGINSVIQVA